MAALSHYDVVYVIFILIGYHLFVRYVIDNSRRSESNIYNICREGNYFYPAYINCILTCILVNCFGVNEITLFPRKFIDWTDNLSSSNLSLLPIYIAQRRKRLTWVTTWVEYRCVFISSNRIIKNFYFYPLE